MQVTFLCLWNGFNNFVIRSTIMRIENFFNFIRYDGVRFSFSFLRTSCLFFQKQKCLLRAPLLKSAAWPCCALMSWNLSYRQLSVLGILSSEKTTVLLTPKSSLKPQFLTNSDQTRFLWMLHLFSLISPDRVDSLHTFTLSQQSVLIDKVKKGFECVNTIDLTYWQM